ncbi:helix-turn-helix transcriptional regulator [Alteromonas sp. 1_MG-2023]|uniref:helix-turn-helix domain-containing protein n=1 Tax=Alteromonas sp. 1_MG-2023 TaxID=3062669 RepID=UPI0026E2F957|nr:helix-turn-helix transcriptional regulator [Alteromonas sp. 1_MG-2023]MDO6475554.1 helix-turn-helix transcriptional regulator [Alteromonas sp. 1_MG-2023]
MFKKVFATRLKQARTAAGLSQKELGLRIGISCSSASGRMNHYEKGRHLPDMETLGKMAEELSVPIAYFFCESDDMAELVTLFSKMSEEERVKCLESLKQFRKV